VVCAVGPLVVPGESACFECLVLRMAGHLDAAGSRAYAVDVTSPDVAALGLTVTRVLAPGLCSLDVGQEARFLGPARLRETAAQLGLRASVLREDDLNPDPHPFP